MSVENIMRTSHTYGRTLANIYKLTTHTPPHSEHAPSHAGGGACEASVQLEAAGPDGAHRTVKVSPVGDDGLVEKPASHFTEVV